MNESTVGDGRKTIVSAAGKRQAASFPVPVALCRQALGNAERDMTINLREFYPHYTDDDYWDVPDEVAAFLQDSERREANYRRRVSYHKAYYSLDLDDGIEGCAILSGPTVDEFFEQQLMYRHLQEALASLPAKQARRIYRHYILGKSKSAIARAEGVSESSVFESISRGLRSMKRFFAP